MNDPGHRFKSAAGCAAVGALCLLAGGCASLFEGRADIGAINAPERRPSFKRLFVYGENRALNHFHPSGWMGDAGDLKMTPDYADPLEAGNKSFRVTYAARGPRQWAGIYWQQPANNWGTVKGGRDLRGARQLMFWARGGKGGEMLSEVKMGGITGRFPDSDSAAIGPLTLSRQWKQYTIPLKGKDLRYISGGFCFVVQGADNPGGCAIFFDDIRYE